MNIKLPKAIVFVRVDGKALNPISAGIMREPRLPIKQQGVTLFTAVMFLIGLSLLGVNAAQMSTLQERMAGNSRNRDLAFQAAEAALKHVENNLGTIRNNIPVPANDTSGTIAKPGLKAINVCLSNSVNYWNGPGAKDCNGVSSQFTWTNTYSLSPSANTLSPEVYAEQPRYVVERMTNTGPILAPIERYRVTARGVGGDKNAVVILQALYTYTPPP